MGRVMFLLDEVEQLADACVRAQRRDAGNREAPQPVPPALRVMHDEFHQIYLTGNAPPSTSPLPRGRDPPA